MSLQKELLKRRTFGIISHPDAGKTTLTEKLLLFGGAIQEAGAVKNNKIKKQRIMMPPVWKWYDKICNSILARRVRAQEKMSSIPDAFCVVI